MVANDGVIFMWHFSKVSINDSVWYVKCRSPWVWQSNWQVNTRREGVRLPKRRWERIGLSVLEEPGKNARVYTLPAYEQVVWYITYKDEGSVINEHNTTKSVYNWMAKTRKRDV